MSLLQVTGLQAWYGPTQALFGVSFKLEQGGITTILGANGAGKTNILEAVSLLSRVNVRWVTKPTTANLTRRYGMDESAGLASTPTTPMSAATGRFDVLIAARWHQPAISGSGACEFVGIDPKLTVESDE